MDDYNEKNSFSLLEESILLLQNRNTHLSNDLFIKFKCFEMMHSKNGGLLEINKNLIKKI